MNLPIGIWINTAIIVSSTMAITLYINYRLGRLIKMLDAMITDRP
jgi:hypothetical protein